MLQEMQKKLKNHPIYKNLRKLKRQLLCPHTHTFHQDIPDAYWVNSDSKNMGRHGDLVFEGCYICGTVTVRDVGK